MTVTALDAEGRPLVSLDVPAGQDPATAIERALVVAHIERGNRQAGLAWDRWRAGGWRLAAAEERRAA